jgi:hypothetical protein
MSPKNIGRSLLTLAIALLILAFLYPDLLLYAIVSVALAGGWFVSRRLSRRSGLALAAAISGFLLTIVIGLTQQVSVNDRHDLETVEFGWPLPWFSQNLSHLDPPFPARVRAEEFPDSQDTKVIWSDLLLDTLVLTALQLGAIGLLALLKI